MTACAIGVVHQLVGGVGARGSVIGVVQQSLRGAIGAVRSELKVARLEQSVVGWEPKAAVWLEPKWHAGSVVGA